MEAPKKILLADDHAILRAGLRLLLDKQPGLTVVGEASDGKEALAKAKALNPDLILMDLSMSGLDGLTTLGALRDVLPHIRVLVLTMHDDASYLREALRAGAAGYLLKKVGDPELLLAIEAVLRGETYIHSAMTTKLLEQVTPQTVPASDDAWAALSEREHEVMRLVALGHTNTEISDMLFISVKTVETYRARGMEKLGLKTRAQLVKSAQERGLLD